MATNILRKNASVHVQSGCSGNDSDAVIPSLPSSDSQPADSPRF